MYFDNKIIYDVSKRIGLFVLKNKIDEFLTIIELIIENIKK